jgi:aspartate/methionine/tyrosine aminotransferase
MSYQGHASWAQWNVSLWVNNDQGLYTMAKRYAKYQPRRDAAKQFLKDLNDSQVFKTPDGARYTVTSLIKAMRGIES